MITRASHVTIGLALLAAASGCLAPRARLHDGADAETRHMQNRVRAYHQGEVDGGAAFTGFAAGSAWTASVLLLDATDATRAAAVPVIAGSAVHLAAGIGIFAGARPRLARLEAQLDADPATFRAEELARMEGVDTLFTAAMAIEGVLIGGGAVAAIAGAATDEDRALGAGLGTMAEMGTLLLHDMFAHARADRYEDDLARFRIAPRIGGDAKEIGVVVGGTID